MEADYYGLAGLTDALKVSSSQTERLWSVVSKVALSVVFGDINSSLHSCSGASPRTLHLLSLLEQGWQHRELSLSAENKSMLDEENRVRKLLAAAPEHPSGGVAAAAAAAAAYPEMATLEAARLQSLKSLADDLLVRALSWGLSAGVSSTTTTYVV